MQLYIYSHKRKVPERNKYYQAIVGARETYISEMFRVEIKALSFFYISESIEPLAITCFVLTWAPSIDLSDLLSLCIPSVISPRDGGDMRMNKQHNKQELWKQHSAFKLEDLILCH